MSPGRRLGTLTLLPLVVRAGWAVTHSRARPGHPDGLPGKLASAGHELLYRAMLVAPVLAVMRMIGSGRPIQLFGLTLRGDAGPLVGWMTSPANLLHGWLGWTPALLIAGHIAMVVVHSLIWKDGTFARMPERPRDAGEAGAFPGT